MSQFLSTIDWATVLQTIWTIIIIPFFTFIGKQVKSYLETKKLGKYTEMLYTAIENVVKDVQDTVVKDIKGTDAWTPEKIEEIKKIAIDKAIASMTMEGYQLLTKANVDFNAWVDSIIQAKLYDLKHKN